MKLFIIVVRDAAADCFGQPQFVPNLGGAVRSFGDEVKRAEKGNVLNTHPEHFSLYKLGDFDDTTATFTVLKLPEQIALASDYAEKSNG